jgi:hypothetical protein
MHTVAGLANWPDSVWPIGEQDSPDTVWAIGEAGNYPDGVWIIFETRPGYATG